MSAREGLIDDDDEQTSEKTRAPAVARASSILRLLAREDEGLGVTEIARRVNLVTSTVFHVLRALVDEGFVTFDADKKTYRTGIGLLTLVRDAMANSDYPKLVQPALDRLAARQLVTAVAVELDSRERMVVVAVSRADSMISLHINVGSRFPSLISATGRCVAAAVGSSLEELHTKFKKLRWERAPRFDDWYADVQRAKTDGFAVDRGNFIRGLTVMATLLPPGVDGVMRGIAAVGFDHNMTEKSLPRLRDALCDAARSTGAQIQGG
jgi:DNA-binding IclR family transcriptional regulator